jgi:hypothetical protein
MGWLCLLEDHSYAERLRGKRVNFDSWQGARSGGIGDVTVALYKGVDEDQRSRSRWLGLVL